MEPERPIEKALRDAAKQRRSQAGPPFELHAADRRLLQGEVVRRYGQRPSRKGLLGEWLPLWPRLAWAVGILAILGFTVVMVFGPETSENKVDTRLAKAGERFDNDKVDLAESVSPVPASPSPPEAASEEPTLARGAKTTERAFGVGAETRGRGGSVARVEQIPASAAARAAPPPTTVGGSLKKVESEGRDELFAGVEEARRQAVATSAAAAKATPASPPVISPAPAAGTLALKMESTEREIAAVTEKPKEIQPERKALADTTTPGSAGSFYWGTGGTQAANRQLFAGRLKESTVAADSVARPEASTTYTSGIENKVSNQRFTRLSNIPASGGARAGAGIVADGRQQPAMAVLNSFAVEQAGQQLKIVDEDGSVYTGPIQVATTPGEAPAAKGTVQLQNAPAPAVAGDAAMAQNFEFQVAGTNRTLKQKVVFAGYIVQELAPDSRLGLSNQVGAAFGKVFQAPAQTQELLRARSTLQNNLQPSQQNVLFFQNNALQNSRISGRVRVADGRELELEALPSQR